MAKTRVLIFLSLSLLIISGLGYRSLLFLTEHPIPHSQDQVVIIQPGTSTYEIGQELTKRHAIPSSEVFFLYAHLHGLNSKLKAGEYQLFATESLASIVHRMARGDVIRHKMTIPEGWTVRQVCHALQNDERLTGALPSNIPEGSLCPSTYVFTRGTPRHTLIDQMQTHQQKVLISLLAQYPQGAKSLKPTEILTLASLVEKETGLPEERARVAGVYLNRLEIGMRLQADPSVAYGLEYTTGQSLGRTLTKDDLAVESPFNTYLHEGLPPTPICNPGRAAIEAVVNPLKTKELFFVANGSGGHTFSERYEQHAVHHEKWRAVRKKQKKTASLQPSS